MYTEKELELFDKWETKLVSEGLKVVYPHPKHSAPEPWIVDAITEAPKYSESVRYDEWLRLLFFIPLLPYGYRAGLYLTTLTDENVNRLSKKVNLQQPTLFRQMEVATKRAKALADSLDFNDLYIPTREPEENTKWLFEYLKKGYSERYESVGALLHYGSVERAAAANQRNYKVIRRHVRLFLEESEFDLEMRPFREALKLLKETPVHLYATNRGLWELKEIPEPWGWDFRSI